MPTKTSWEDMALMGATKREVFLILNPLRGNTMTNESHLHLNDSFVEDYGWYCYNKITGDAVLVGSEPIDVTGTTIAYTWDNTNNSEPWEETRTESYSRTTTTTLTNTTSASITIEQSVTIFNVASSGYSLTLGTESTSEVSTTISEEQTAQFTVTVYPGEKVQLIRTRTELGQNATYRVPYGIDGMIGTQGDKYNSHYHWGYPTTVLGKSLSGNYYVNGVNRNIDYSFTINRVSGTGAVKSKAVYVSPRGSEYNVELEIHDGDTPDIPKSGEVGIPGY